MSRVEGPAGSPLSTIPTMSIGRVDIAPPTLLHSRAVVHQTNQEGRKQTHEKHRFESLSHRAGDPGCGGDHGPRAGRCRLRQLRVERLDWPCRAARSRWPPSASPTDAYETVLQPGFQGTEDGADVTFTNSFGASGDQSRAVEAGQPAGHRLLALGPDVERLVDAGLVDDDWDDGEYKGTNRVRRGVHGPWRQPEEHQELGRPDPRRRGCARPEPVHLGWCSLGHHGRLRSSDRGGRPRTRPGVHEEAASRTMTQTRAPPTRSRRSPPAARATR